MTDSEPQSFSPFESPKKEVKIPGMTDNTGMRIEQITDSDLDGKTGATSGPSTSPNTGPIDTPFDDAPRDAPVFNIPVMDQVPNAEIPPTSGGGNSGNGGSKTTGGPDTKMDPEFTKGLSEFTAKWLVDMYFKLLIMGLVSYAKIDKKELLAGVREGYINEKFVKYVDQANKNVENGITVTEEEKKFIIEPLKYFLEVKKVNIKPEYMFLGGLVMVSGQVFMRANEIKKENKEILDRIIQESAEIRNRTGNGSRPTGETYEEKQSFSNQTFSVDNPNDPKDENIVHFGPGDVEEIDPNNAM